jgi:hypothetical protein
MANGCRYRRILYVEQKLRLKMKANFKQLTIIKIEEDRAFLLAQRQKCRPGSMTSVDTVLVQKELQSHQLLANNCSVSSRRHHPQVYLKNP